MHAPSLCVLQHATLQYGARHRGHLYKPAAPQAQLVEADISLAPTNVRNARYSGLAGVKAPAMDAQSPQIQLLLLLVTKLLPTTTTGFSQSVDVQLGRALLEEFILFEQVPSTSPHVCLSECVEER